MRRFLVVGCGGTGGKTLAYMMDQLTAELHEHDINKIPAGWQFVNVDVPLASEKGPEGLGDVPAQGGSYVPTGQGQGVGYYVVDDGVSAKLGSVQDGLAAIGSWAPKEPRQVSVPISAGAGQYRAVGRMIALSKLLPIRESLQGALTKLSARDVVEPQMHDAVRAMPELGKFDFAEDPIVIVVSSMAGGAGASMAIDVCRLLAELPGVNPDLIGVFMAAADVFDELPPGDRKGVRANSLAMYGEIVAAQAGAAQEHDLGVMQKLGVPLNRRAVRPFQRVFPVGTKSGMGRTPFGDQKMLTIYRGIGHGLASMMASGSASDQLVSYSFGNPPTSGRREYLGWGLGLEGTRLPWGSFGFARLSLGRERYREYAAQRLARASADRLLDGHLRDSTATPAEQIAQILSVEWPRILQQVGLPDTSTNPQNAVRDWFRSSAYRHDEAMVQARSLAEAQLRGLPEPQPGNAPQDWLGSYQRQFAQRQSAVRDAVDQAALSWSYRWQQGFAQRVYGAVENALGSYGIPYALEVVRQLEAHAGTAVAQTLGQLSGRLDPGWVGIPQGAAAQVGKIRGAISNAQAVLKTMTDAFVELFRDALGDKTAGLLSRILEESKGGLFDPLKQALENALEGLQAARDSADSHKGLAVLATDLYGAWPSDTDKQVPSRFGQAQNEILLTPIDDFMRQYAADLIAAVGPTESGGLSVAVQIASSNVIRGQWEADGSPPGGLVTVDTGWWPRALPVHPDTGAAVVPVTAQVAVNVEPAELLQRARGFVSRTNWSFSNFFRESLKSWVQAAGQTDLERKRRADALVSRFRETLAMAQPLGSVNRQAVPATDDGGASAQYSYNFSEVPFKLEPALADELANILSSSTDIEQTTVGRFEAALSDDNVTRLDVFGNYGKYSPLVYDSVLEPVAAEWGGLGAAARREFWQWRRARPLPASLPMGDVERRAMVAGWYIGHMTGRLRVPAQEDIVRLPVSIWDAQKTAWTDFPYPMLTPPDTPGFETYDLLPAVLESVLLAHAKALQDPLFSSLRPYLLLRALFDDAEADPAQGLARVAWERNIAAWLLNGVTGTGRPSGVPGAAGAADIEARVECTVAWLTQVRDFAADFLPSGKGAFSAISRRDQAAKTPLFHDIAPDVHAQAGLLIDCVRKAAEAARRPEPSAVGSPASESAQPVVAETSFEAPKFDGGAI